MKKLLLIPVIIFPYLPALGVLLGKLFPENTDSTVFGVFFALLALATPVCNIIFMILSRKDDPRGLIRAAFLVKLVHIPAYIVIFIFGAIAAIMIFMTLPLILMLILFDYIALLSSNFISVFALAKNVKNNKMLSVAALICQFFFYADVISLFVLWIASRNQKQTISA